MTSKRELLQNARFLTNYFSTHLLGLIQDPRSNQGMRWKSCIPLLRGIFLGLITGAKGLGEVEELTSDLSKQMRRVTKIKRKIPDTTLRNLLCKLNPDNLCRLIYIVGYDAWRRKALKLLPDFSFHALSLDGKYPSIKTTKEYKYLQIRHDTDGNESYGLLRTITAALITSPGRPILAANPVLGTTNEQGSFKKAFGDVLRIYGKLFQMVMYDAGAASASNAETVVSAGKDYLFNIADKRWDAYEMMELLFKDTSNIENFRDEEIKGDTRLVRSIYILPSFKNQRNSLFWKSTNTLIKIVNRKYKGTTLKSEKSRYFVSSMKADAFEMTPEKWLRLIVLRWGVETAHQILDETFLEDKRLWISKDAQGALNVILLRRIAYTLLTLFRSVTLRNEDKRYGCFRRLMEKLKYSLIWPTPLFRKEEDFFGRNFTKPKYLGFI